MTSPPPTITRHGKKQTNIGEYEILGTISRTTTCKVKLGVNRESGERVAIKILPISQLDSIEREVRALREIHHPNVVQFRRLLRSKKYIYVITEYCEGGDLLACIPPQGFEEQVALYYFRQLLAGLAAVHAAGLAHRDLKPENLLLDQSRRILRLADFGLVGDQLSRQMLTTSCGTPFYVAPEIVTSACYDGFLADIWSCGIILFFMLNGSVPFSGTTFAELYSSQLRGEYVWNRSVSPAARKLVRRMLQPNPQSRITLKQIARHPWFVYGIQTSTRDSSSDSSSTVAGCHHHSPTVDYSAYELTVDGSGGVGCSTPTNSLQWTGNKSDYNQCFPLADPQYQGDVMADEPDPEVGYLPLRPEVLMNDVSLAIPLPEAPRPTGVLY